MSMTSFDESRVITERMELLRSRLDDDASQLAASTHEMLDWKTYARKFPAGFLATGLLTGILLAPRRRADPVTRAVNQVRDVAIETIEAVPEKAEAEKAEQAGILAGLLHGSVVPWVRGFLWSYVKGFAMSQVDTFLRSSRPAVNDPEFREQPTSV